MKLTDKYFGIPVWGWALGVTTLIAITSRKSVPGARSIIALGDSQTAAGLYAAELVRLFSDGSTAKAFGYAGQQTRVIATHVNEAVSPGTTDVIVYSGTNDIGAGRSLDAMKADLIALWASVRAKTPRARLIGVTIPPWGRVEGGEYKHLADRDSIRKAFNSFIATSSIPDAVVSTDSLSDANGRLRADLVVGDQLHLNKAGQSALAKLIAQQAFGRG